MLVARAGNVALMKSLLDSEANPIQRDEFGHTAWLHALGGALEESDCAAGPAALSELLVSVVLDADRRPPGAPGGAPGRVLGALVGLQS